jgi:hypothetical protein
MCFPRAAELAPVASETGVIAVEVADGQGRLSPPRMVVGVDGGVGGADPALSRDAREKTGRDRDLVRLKPPRGGAVRR